MWHSKLSNSLLPFTFSVTLNYLGVEIKREFMFRIQFRELCVPDWFSKIHFHILVEIKPFFIVLGCFPLRRNRRRFPWLVRPIFPEVFQFLNCESRYSAANQPCFFMFLFAFFVFLFGQRLRFTWSPQYNRKINFNKNLLTSTFQLIDWKSKAINLVLLSTRHVKSTGIGFVMDVS